MEDRVAEILAERAAMKGGVAAAVFVSLLAHAGLSGMAVWAAFRHTKPQMPAVMNIRFAKMPAISGAPPPPPAAIVAPKPVAEGGGASPKPAAKPVAASPFGKSTKKATPAQAPVAPAPTETEAPPQSDVVLEGGDFPSTIDIDRMKTIIGSRWLRPQVSAGVTAIVYFVIERDGTLRDAAVEKPSGDATFDRGALRAVLESSPQPPLPFGYSGTYLGVHLTFR